MGAPIANELAFRLSAATPDLVLIVISGGENRADMCSVCLRGHVSGQWVCRRG